MSAARLVTALVAAGMLTIQCVCSLALASYGVPPAWMRLAPAAWRTAAAGAIEAGFPAPRAARIGLVRAALADGDTATASRRAAALAPSPERSILQGLIAEREGDAAAAGAAYARGGDPEDAARLVDALAARGNTAAALHLQLTVIAALPATRENAAARADAWWRLGRLYQASAYDLPIAQRGPLEQKSAGAYDAAAVLAPLSAKFLLAAANERLNLDEPAAARPLFERLLGQDPSNVDALLGLAEASVLSGDLATARGYLSRARALGYDPRVEAFVRSMPL